MRYMYTPIEQCQNTIKGVYESGEEWKHRYQSAKLAIMGAKMFAQANELLRMEDRIEIAVYGRTLHIKRLGDSQCAD